MSLKTGSVTGGILLISGSCIGAGMLGIPVLSATAGFTPSVFMFIVSWFFMTCTGLLLLEVNLWFENEVSIISMAAKTLGWVGKALSWFLYLFLFYSLMVAYMAASGELFSDFFETFTQIKLPHWIGSLVMATLLGLMLYLGTHAVDRFNRVMMMGLIFSYVFLVMMGASHVKPSLLYHQDWKASAFILPVMIISFGFHNLIPSLTYYLNRDPKKLRLAVLVGSVIPLFIYLTWQWFILGLVPLEGQDGLIEALHHGDIATHVLKKAIGSSQIVDIAQYFAFFALVTSFLGVALGFVDFLADGLSIEKNLKGKIFLCFIVLIPPLIFSYAFPHVFLNALNYAGGFGAVILFGLLPAAMVWSGRYYLKMKNVQFVAGGKPLLIVVLLFYCLVMGLQVIYESA